MREGQEHQAQWYPVQTFPGHNQSLNLSTKVINK